MDRREFLKSSGMVALAPMLGRSAPKQILVTIHMQGGNDALNTLVPYADDAYYFHRKEVNIPKHHVLRLNTEVGLHPSLRGFAELLEAGNASIIQGVGYENTSPSHYRSLAVWETGQTDPYAYHGTGWLGRVLYNSNRPEEISAVSIGKTGSPIAFRGCHSVNVQTEEVDDQLHSDVTRYPHSQIGNDLCAVASLIKGGSSAKAYYTRQFGYDTHVGQLPNHARNLSELSDALAEFYTDMYDSGFAKQILVLAYSEFGRAFKKNISLGTDHGSEGVVMLSGDAITDRMPGLGNGTRTDYRQIYAEILNEWLDASVQAVLYTQFEQTQFLQNKTEKRIS